MLFRSADGRGFVAAFALGAVGVQMGTRFLGTAESDLNRWGQQQILAMRETDTVITKVMTGATVRYLRTPEITAYEDALTRGAPEAEMAELRRAARASRNEERADRRQFAVGQIGAMIDDAPTVAEVMEGILQSAAALARQLPAFATREQR